MNRTARISVALLGALLTSMGLGKGLSWSGYVVDLNAFVLPAPAAVVAGAMTAIELSAGALLLWAAKQGQPSKPGRAGAGLALVDAALYAGLSSVAFAQGLSIDNCTCFGTYLPQALSGWVLLQDAYMLAWSGFVARTMWRQSETNSIPKVSASRRSAAL